MPVVTDFPTDPGELQALAGDYVIGTVDARMAARIEGALPTHAGLAAAVQGWETLLAPLSALAVPEAPPAGLWDRIEHAIAPAMPTRPAPRPRFLRFWQGWAIGASLVAAALATVTLLPQPAGPQMMTVLVADAAQTAWTAEVDRKGGLRLAALPAAGGAANDTAPVGHQLQLWALAPGAKAPVSLGLVPRGGQSVTIAAPVVTPVPGMLIMISLEPPGGAPGASPTGPVIFVGRLSEAGPPT